MSVQLVLKNSSVQDKEATAAQLAVGELALNYHSSGPFLQCEDSAGNIWRLGGVVIASTAPTSPSKGAWWLDSDDDHLYFYDGSSWIEIQTGEIVPGDITEGTARQLLQTNAAGNGTEWTSNIDVPGTLDVTGVATFDNNVVISGNLTVDGTTTTIDSTTLVVEDKNVELGAVDTPTDTTANGGGITLKGATDKTLTWVSSTGAWTFNQPLDVNGEVECDGIANGTSSVSVANNGNVTITRAGTTSIDVVGNGVQLPDNINLRLGSSSDLQIYHDQSNSYISDIGTGDLVLKSSSTFVRDGSDNAMLNCNASGSVQAFHNGSQKLATTSTGIDVTGSVTCNAASPQVVLQDNNNTGVGAVGSIVSQDSGGSSKWLVGDFSTANENLYLYNYATADLILSVNNGGKQINFTSAGHFVPADNNAQDLGTSSSQWRNAWFDGTVNCDQLDVDGTIDIAGDANFFGNVDLQDNDRLRLGSGDDLQIYHDGSNSVIADTGTGQLQILTNQLRVNNAANNENLIACDQDGNVQIYNDGALKFATTSTGIDVTGSVTCDGLTVDGSMTQSSGQGLLSVKDNNNTGTSTQAYVRGLDSADTEKWQVGQSSSSNDDLYVLNNSNGKVVLGTNGFGRVEVTSAGHLVPNADNTYDLGTSSTEWRHGYFDGNVVCDGLEVDGAANFDQKVYLSENTATASSFDLQNGNFWTFGAIAVPNPTNQTAGMMGSLRVTAAPTSFAANWKFPGGTYTAPTSFPAVAPFFVQASGTILVGSWTEGIA